MQSENGIDICLCDCEICCCYAWEGGWSLLESKLNLEILWVEAATMLQLQILCNSLFLSFCTCAFLILYSVFVGEQIEVGNSVDSSPHNALVTGGRHRYEYMQHNHEFVLFEIALFLENISKSKKIIITYFTYVRLTKKNFYFQYTFLISVPDLLPWVCSNS